MSIRKIPFAIGEFYHIYNRGNSKQKIFHNKQDYDYFIKLLLILNQDKQIKTRDINNFSEYEKAGTPLVSIGAYVLMPNHFHILITDAVDGGISKFMQKISTAYVMYYNQKYKRSGSLFEGKFKAQHLDTDRYLKYIFSYIHLNPIKLIQKDWKDSGIKNKSKALEFLLGYTYSSYIDYLSIDRMQNKILTIKDFPRYFPTTESFSKDVFEWLSYND